MTNQAPPAPWTGNQTPDQDPKAAAKAAKAYAKASRPWYMKKRWWLAAVIIVIIAASAASGGGGSDSEPAADDSSSQPSDTSMEDGAPSEEQAKPTKPKPKAGVKAVQVQAAAIVKEFEDNELAADAKYKGKSLRIKGVVSEIDTELFDDKQYILRLGGGGDYEFLTVACNDMSTDELSTLNKGERVTVVGKFDDGGDLGVEVKDCSLA